MLRVKIIFVILSLNLTFVVGTNQQLICKPMDDVYTDGPDNTLNTRRVLYGPPGKRGQKGVKGEPGVPKSRGEKGLPGLVDPQNVENVIEKKMEEANRELLRRMETLEKLVGSLTDTISINLNCLEGVVYKKKCYFVIMPDDKGFLSYGKNGSCSERGGKPADLLNREHQDVIVSYIRRKRVNGTHVFLGMTYLPFNSTMVWSSGKKVPADVAGALLWRPGYPSYRWGYYNYSYRRLILGVAGSVGIYYNQPYYYYTYHTTGNGVLCQK